jgi:hypothetical protein
VQPFYALCLHFGCGLALGEQPAQIPACAEHALRTRDDHAAHFRAALGDVQGFYAGGVDGRFDRIARFRVVYSQNQSLALAAAPKFGGHGESPVGMVFSPHDYGEPAPKHLCARIRAKKMKLS